MNEKYSPRFYDDVLQVMSSATDRFEDFATIKTHDDAEIAATLVRTGWWEGSRREFRIQRNGTRVVLSRLDFN